jgi:hypothetical protein
MKRIILFLTLVILLTAGVTIPSSNVEAAPSMNNTATSLTGQWHGSFYHYYLYYGATFSMYINQEYGYVIIYLPEGGLVNQALPAYFGTNSITIYAGTFAFAGTVTGDSIAGYIWDSGYQVAYWQIYREIEDLSLPDPDPDTSCDELPPIYTIGDVEYTAEILPFDPDYGPGYIDYPVNGETWEDQYRSYARRDLIQLVKYASAKVECITADWDYWDFAPVGLIDMSEADGSTPGTSTGYPGHPQGTHMYGNDMDAAYYQLYAPDNFPRSVGVHFEDGYDAFHLTGEPLGMDPWRTALLIAYISEHHHLRVIGVDGQIGPILEDALDELVTAGYIDSDLRDSIPLAYEVENQGYGWYYHHHHHMHISMNTIYDVGAEVDIKPETLNLKSQGKYITGYLELGYGLDINYVDVENLKLVVSGDTAVSAEKADIADYNNNGIPDLTIKFDRSQVTDAIDTGEVEVALTGTIYQYYHFQETDTITVID